MHFYGFDVPGGRDGKIDRPRVAINHALRLLAQHDGKFAGSTQQQRTELAALINEIAAKCNGLPSGSAGRYTAVRSLAIAGRMLQGYLELAGRPLAEQGPAVIVRDGLMFEMDDRARSRSSPTTPTNPPPMLGTLLRPHFRDDLVVIGSGSLRAADSLAPKLRASTYVEGSAAKACLTSKQGMAYKYGDNPIQLVPATAFDAFLFLEEITGVTHVKR